MLQNYFLSPWLVELIFLILVLFSSLLDSFLWAIASYLLDFYLFGLLKFSNLTLFKFAMAFHHNPLLRMPTIAIEARVVLILWCMLVLFGVLLVLSSLSLWSKGRPWRLHQHEDLRIEYSEFSKTLVKWGSILYKASLTFIFLAILCNSQIHFIMQVHSFISWIPYQGSVEAWRSLSFSLVSPNLRMRFLLSGVVCHTPKFLILGCA